MNKIIYILAKKGKFKVDISQYVTLRFVLINYKVRVFIDNHFQADDGQKINYNKYVNEVKTAKSLNSFLDISQVKSAIDEEYNKCMALAKNAEVARLDLATYIQWDSKTNEDLKDMAMRIVDAVANNHRVQIAPNKVLIISNYYDKGISNVYSDLHYQIVEIKVNKNGEIKKDYPELCSGQIYGVLKNCISKYGKQIEQHLSPIEERIRIQKVNTTVNYEFLRSRYLKPQIIQEQQL